MNLSLKSKLKSNPFIYRSATIFKSKKIKKNYSKMLATYGHDSLTTGKRSAESFLQKQRDAVSQQKKTPELKIFYLGTDELQDKSGFLQSLGKFAEVRYFTKENGSYGQYGRNDREWKTKNHQRLKTLFCANSEESWIPDILLMQTWEWRIGKQTLEWVKRIHPECKIINIGWDDRHALWENGNQHTGTGALAPYLDLMLTSTPEACDWFQTLGTKAIYWPEASDSSIFYPLNTKKIYDVGFVGASYGIRKEIVTALQKADINIKAYGNGWPAGRLAVEDTNLFFNQCEIVLGCGTIKQCRDFYALKLRDFDVPMSGAVYVTHHNPDLESLFTIGDEIITCIDTSDFVIKIRQLLDSPDKKEKIRTMARNKSIEHHTFEARICLMLHHLYSHKEQEK